MEVSKGNVPWSGDISGAYYATKGNGFIHLPANWPRGVGGYEPNEIVELLCAIPGDRLSSGLFLSQLDDLLISNGFELLFGRTKRFMHANGRYTYLLNYSDDLIGFSPSTECMNEVETIIRKSFKVSLEEGFPTKWVGMDLEYDETGELSACSASTFRSYELPFKRFALSD